MKCEQGAAEEHAEAIEVHDGYVAFFPPRNPDQPFDAELEFERYTAEPVNSRAPPCAFCGRRPSFCERHGKAAGGFLVLLTNGRGGMARLCVDLGRSIRNTIAPWAPICIRNFRWTGTFLSKRIRVWITADGFITALNLQNLASLQAGPPAVWNFVAEAGDGRTVELQMTADMLEGSNTTVFTFARLPGTRPADLPPQFDVRITVRVDIEDRNFHTETHRNDGAEYHFTAELPHAGRTDWICLHPGAGPAIARSSKRGRLSSGTGMVPGHSASGRTKPRASRQGRRLQSGLVRYSVGQGATRRRSSFRPRLPAPAFEAADAAAGNRLAAEKAALEGAKLPETIRLGDNWPWPRRAFVARRGTGRTVIAGYPWFLDWGRDTFISARGLLAAGMVTEVVDLLVSFGQFVENGTMPNTIHGGNASNRDTSDAPLWYGVVCEEAAAIVGEQLYQTRVDKSGRTIADVLREIAVGYARGTPNGIRMDPASALIWSPPHFTWMDTNYPACTPREGYPVEIQVLWIRLLRQLHRLGIAPVAEPWDVMADRAEQSLRKFFWLEEKGYIADLLIAESGQPAAGAVRDNALRCNYLFAIAFGFLDGARAQRAVAAAWRYLLVPGGIADAGAVARLAAVADSRRRWPAAQQSRPALLGDL